MTGRVPACEEPGIAERLAEIQAERLRAIAGCHCPRDMLGQATHNPQCPLRPPAASQMEMAREAIQRARLRAYRTRGMPQLSADDIIEHAIAAKYARHRVLS